MTRRNRPAVNWPALRAEVVARDRAEMLRVLNLNLPFFIDRKYIVCIAPLVDIVNIRKCWGRTTLDHVKPEPRLGVKAEDIPEQIVSVCQGHMEDGMKAGYQWNTASRAEEREYLRRIYGPE